MKAIGLDQRGLIPAAGKAGKTTGYTGKNGPGSR